MRQQQLSEQPPNGGFLVLVLYWNPSQMPLLQVWEFQYIGLTHSLGHMFTYMTTWISVYVYPYKLQRFLTFHRKGHSPSYWSCAPVRPF